MVLNLSIIIIIFGIYIYVVYLIIILIFGINVYVCRRSWMEWGQSKITSYSESSLSAVAIVWWASSILSPILTKVRTYTVLTLYLHCTYTVLTTTVHVSVVYCVLYVHKRFTYYLTVIFAVRVRALYLLLYVCIYLYCTYTVRVSVLLLSLELFCNPFLFLHTLKICNVRLICFASIIFLD